MGIEGTDFNIIEAIYDKPTPNIILNGEKLNESLLRSGTRQGCLLLLLLFNIVLEVLAMATREEKEMKRMPNWKSGSKTVTILDDIILCIGNPKDTTRKLFRSQQ